MHSQHSLYCLLLDGFDVATPIDGYLPPILKTRLEFRRGNSLKILTLLNQVFEAEENEDPSIVSSKGSFYYSLLSSVYFGSGMLEMARNYLMRAIRCSEEENCDNVTKGGLIHNMAIVCLLLNDFDNAQKWMKKALFLLPENPMCWFRYGEICYKNAMAGNVASSSLPPFSRSGEFVFRDNPFSLLQDTFGREDGRECPKLSCLQ